MSLTSDTLLNLPLNFPSIDASPNATLSDRFNLINQIPNDVNDSFTLSSGYLVFFMQCGFAMLCAGSVRAHNAKNIILLNIMDSCFGVSAWYFTGFAFAFGDAWNPTVIDPDNGVEVANPTPFSGNGFIGTKHFFMINLPKNRFYFWFFQFAFAATGATIVSGAIAERAKFGFYMVYIFLIVMWIYPTIAHWQWSPSGWLGAVRSPNNGGLLFNSGNIDYAGDGPVHMIGGVASFWACWILGPRIGRFDSDGKPNDMPGHNAALTLLGVFVLWFGWYGFNPGSVNVITPANANNGPYSLPAGMPEVGLVAVNTTLAAAWGAIGTLFICMFHNYFAYGVTVWDLVMCGNGALAGLVSITGPCATVFPWSAVILGFFGGIVYYASSKLVLHVFKMDDPLDAIAVHFFCGMWGLVCVGLFSAESIVTQVYGTRPDGGQRDWGVFLGGNGNLLGCQLIQILVIFGWVTAFSFPVFFACKKLGIMRVSPEVEAQGLDLSFHGGHCYPGTETTEKGVSTGGMDFNSPAFERKLQAAVEKALATNGNGGKAVV